LAVLSQQTGGPSLKPSAPLSVEKSDGGGYFDLELDNEESYNYHLSYLLENFVCFYYLVLRNPKGQIMILNINRFLRKHFT
jgi:hypothetical protein